MVAAIAISGDLGFNPMKDTLLNESGEEVKLDPPTGWELPPKGFDVEYDTTFGLRRVAKETVVDTTVTVLMLTEDGAEDTVYVQKRNLKETLSDPLFLNIVSENTFERIETVSYFDRRFRKERDPYDFLSLPDSSQFNCPLTGDPYIIEISDNSIRVSSPIRSYRENRYGFFSLKTRSHGYIIDGTRSWDN